MKNVSKADERLKTAAGFVRQGSRLLDIGTDHAYLPCYLIKSGVCTHATASDVVEGPLEAARKSIRSRGLEDCIDLYLSDGFDSVPENCADDIVIAGMGGMLITELLSRCEWIRNEDIRLILQPMTHPEYVRRFLFENGFEIQQEKACVSENKVYCVLCAAYTGEKRSFSEADCYIGALPASEENRKEAALFLSRQLLRLRKRLEALEKIGKNEEECASLRQITREMEKIL